MILEDNDVSTVHPFSTMLYIRFTLDPRPSTRTTSFPSHS